MKFFFMVLRTVIDSTPRGLNRPCLKTRIVIQNATLHIPGNQLAFAGKTHPDLLHFGVAN